MISIKEHIKEKLKEYIKNNLEPKEKKKRLFPFGAFFARFEEEECLEDDYYTDSKKYRQQKEKKIYDWAEETEYKEKTIDIKKFIKEHNKYTNFQKTLFKMIDERNLKDSDVYNNVHLDRRTFAKIRNEKYHPSKETVILLAISLKLNEKELEDLLDSAAYSLPKNNEYDLIIRFCFINGIYNIIDINDLLDEYGCKLFNY